uniref:OB domain-containing protein n=1 Tax=Oryza punctata TaxID=4537 RepID=A0A0E0KR98_ORYPU
MAGFVSWYGPLIDLSAAAGHLGGFVQFLASVRRVLPHQEQNAADGRAFQKTMLEVGDDTRSRFCVSLWPKHGSSVLAGDVLLLQNIKIVEFRNGLEGRASQISAVQVLLNSKDLVKQSGIDELMINCKVGDNTKSKLRRVVEWAWMQHNKCTLSENYHKVRLKNWKDEKEKESGNFLSISELLSQSKLHGVGVYASISKMVNLHGENTYPIDCPKSPNYLHVIGQIYKPFMIYVRDQSGQIPVHVRNKAAEILFANIIADDVSECYKNHHPMLLDTCDCGSLNASGGETGIIKRKRTKEKPDWHLIWLIIIKCLLNQHKNSPFCLQISVNPEKSVEDGRFELVAIFVRAGVAVLQIKF